MLLIMLSAMQGWSALGRHLQSKSILHKENKSALGHPNLRASHGKQILGKMHHWVSALQSAQLQESSKSAGSCRI